MALKLIMHHNRRDLFTASSVSLVGCINFERPSTHYTPTISVVRQGHKELPKGQDRQFHLFSEVRDNYIRRKNEDMNP